MLVQIQFRSDTLAAWTAANPVLAVGEPGYEEDTHRLRIGDGVSPFLNLVVQNADLAAFQVLTDQALAAAAAAQEAADQATIASGGLTAATETVPGVVELATAGEVTTGTDATRVVTPATLANRLLGFTGAPPDATTVVKGVVELATNAEVVTGVDTVRAATPAGVKAALDSSGVTSPDATTTVKGIVELATDAETITGTDTVRATTPANVKAAMAAAGAAAPADASATVKGIVELATDAEAVTGTDTVRATTPANVKAAINAGAVVLTGAQTVAGVKTFSSAPVVPDNSFAIAKVSGLAAAIGHPVQMIRWTGSAWQYNGVTVTARPTASTSTSYLFYDLTGAATLPSWALDGYDIGLQQAL